MHDWQSEVRARLAALRLKPEREADIVDEIAQHLAERYREAVSAGASPDEATRFALADFRPGNALAQRIAALRQAHTPAAVTLGASTGHLLEDLWHDLRYAARSFAKQPGFAVTVVMTLAAAIGAASAIFSVIDSVLLRPLPVPDADRLIIAWKALPAAGVTHWPLGRAELAAAARTSRTLAAVGGVSYYGASREIATELGAGCAAAGLVVVSGMALGCDEAAHRGALAADGRTIAVLAGGPDHVHPRSNAELYRRIVTTGAVVSEPPPGMIPAAWHFAARDRIMAALSAMTVVAAGAVPSGTQITADEATHLHREVGAVHRRHGAEALDHAVDADPHRPLPISVRFIRHRPRVAPRRLPPRGRSRS